MPSRQDDVRAVLDQVEADGRTSLTAPECKTVCDAYDIPVPAEGLAQSADEASAIADKIGYPVVMKIVSPDILHKTAWQTRKLLLQVMTASLLMRELIKATPTSQECRYKQW